MRLGRAHRYTALKPVSGRFRRSVHFREVQGLQQPKHTKTPQGFVARLRAHPWLVWRELGGYGSLGLSEGDSPMEPHSVELRSQILAACDANEGTRAVALRFKVSESWFRLIKQQRRETGQVAPKTAAPRQPKWHAWADWLLSKIAARPDIYLRELQVDLLAERNEDVCLQTICNACQALEQTRKKRL